MNLSHLDERCQNLQLEILHVSDPIGAPLNDANLVVESLHKAERDFMIGTAVADDAIPMTPNQSNELLVRFQTAPLELGLPVLKELSSPGGIAVIPKLSEGFFEHIGFAQALIGLEQKRQGAPSVQIEIGFMRQKRIALSFDEAFVLGGDPGIFPPPHFVQRLRQMLEHMELVEDDLGVGRMAQQRIPEGLPHIHDRQAQGTISLGSHIVEEPVHVLFSAPQLFAHPDRPLLIQVGDHDSVTLSFLDRDFINADGPQTLPGQMLGPEISHVTDIHPPNLVPIQPVAFCHLFDGHRSTEPANVLLEPLGKTPGLRQPGEGFLLHASTTPAVHPPIFEFQIDARAAGVQIADSMSLAVVEAARDLVA